MQLYHGTYLRGFEFTIPKELFNNGNFLKYSELKVHVIVRNDFIKKPEEFFSDAIQLFITPYSSEPLKNLSNELKKYYWLDLSMRGVKGAFSKILCVLKEKFNILECRGGDTAEKLMETLELIAKYADNDIVTLDALQKVFDNSNVEDNIKIVVNDVEPLFDRQAITDVNYTHVATYTISLPLQEQQKIENKGEVGNENANPENYTVDFNTLDREICDDSGWKAFKNQLGFPKRRYLSITSFSDRNFISVIFKNIDELILPLSVTFNQNTSGLLFDFINPLRKIGVNFKLIIPQKLEATNVYNIHFDIVNTILTSNHFDWDHMKELIIAHITNKNISINIDKNENFPYGTEVFSNANQIIIDEINKVHKEVNDDIKDNWLERLKCCNGNGNCNIQTINCFLQETGNREIFLKLLDKYENLINYVEYVKQNIITQFRDPISTEKKKNFEILKNKCQVLEFDPEKGNCGMGGELENFYQSHSPKKKNIRSGTNPVKTDPKASGNERSSQTHKLIVKGGNTKGDGFYKAGERVLIAARPAKKREIFGKWVGMKSAKLNNEKAQSTILIMGEDDETIEAKFEKL